MIVNGHDAWKLTKSWLIRTNDDFFRLYGFNWVPPVWMQEKVKKEIWNKILKKDKYFI